MTVRRILLISGVARSGTSAMVYFLNRHPQCAIGMERYKHRFATSSGFSEELFDQARFFEFQEADTDVNPARLPEARRLWIHFRASSSIALSSVTKSPIELKSLRKFF